jgi:hypothetical protein
VFATMGVTSLRLLALGLREPPERIPEPTRAHETLLPIGESH